MLNYLCPNCEAELTIPDYWGEVTCATCGHTTDYLYVTGYWRGRSSMLDDMRKLDELHEEEIKALEEIECKNIEEANQRFYELQSENWIMMGQISALTSKLEQKDG
jgi:uncharacterized Zn finger protein (UPF0148 family)